MNFLQRGFRKATIKDVAMSAGVSTTTVSVFVSGRESVCAPETAERIREAVKAFQYTPSHSSRVMHSRRTTIIGVCAFSLAEVPENRHGAFAERVFRGIAREADQSEYCLLHFPASIRDGEPCDAFLDGRIDGLIFSAGSDEARLAPVARAGMPVVTFTRAFALPEEVGAVYADESDTARLALAHLWDRGHRRIAHIAGPHQHGIRDPATGILTCSDAAIWRLRAYQEEMTGRGAFAPALVESSLTWGYFDADAVLAKWLSLPEPPTAVFAANDDLGFLLIAAARRAGLSVPRDLSVVGVDAVIRTDAPEGEPSRLSSVDVPGEAVGREALRLLLRLMNGEEAGDCRTSIPVSRIVEAGTTAPTPRD